MLYVAVVPDIGFIEEQVIALVVLVEAVGEFQTVAVVDIPLSPQTSAEIAVTVPLSRKK